MREPLLHIMYAYRKERYMRAMLIVSENLFNIIANFSKNERILKYILSTGPPAYTCRRYWDWIEPYLVDMI